MENGIPYIRRNSLATILPEGNIDWMQTEVLKVPHFFYEMGDFSTPQPL
jgi:hypothetical protein